MRQLYRTFIPPFNDALVRRFPVGFFLVLLFAGSLAAATASGDSADIRITRDVVYAHTGGVEVKLDVYRPPTIGRSRPTVVLIHGGGFRNGDKSALARFGDVRADRRGRGCGSR